MADTPPSITTLPTAPSKTDRANFDSRADAFVAALTLFSTQINELGDWSYDTALEVYQYYLDALSASDAAVAATNYQGDWDDLEGALDAGSSVTHNGTLWLLTEALLDVTAKEPGVDAEWLEIRSWITKCNTMTDLMSASTNNGVILLGFSAAGDGGGGLFYYDSAKSKALHNGGTVIDPDHSVTPGESGWYANQNTGLGCWCRLITKNACAEWFGSSTVTLYVSTTGSNDNTGFASTKAKLTLQAAIDTLAALGPFLSGTWKISLAAGTYYHTSAASLEHLYSNNRIEIYGPDVSYGVPTAIIDGTGGSTYDHGLRFIGRCYVTAKDLKFQNFTATGNNRIGLTAEHGVDLYTVNVHATSCSWAGIYAQNAIMVRVSGGIIDACYDGIGMNNSAGTIGYGVSPYPEIKNCTNTGVYWSRGSQGHIDNCTLDTNVVGVWVDLVARCHVTYSDFKKNTVAVRTASGGIYTETSNTFNAGTGNANTAIYQHKAYTGPANVDNQLRLSVSARRIDRDWTQTVHTGTTNATTIYDLGPVRAYTIGSADTKVSLVVYGVGTWTNGTKITVRYGSDGEGWDSCDFVFYGAGSSAPFKLECDIQNNGSGDTRFLGSIMHSTAAPRVIDTLGSSIDHGLENTVNVQCTLQAAGDSVTFRNAELFITGA